MPELPEVETVRRLIQRALLDKKIVAVELAEDAIVISDRPVVHSLLTDARLIDVGRRGKFFWLQTERGFVGAHLGMSGWVRDTSLPEQRLLNHGNKPLNDDSGEPRFLKMRLRAEDGSEVVMTDARRFARIWPSEGPLVDPRITSLSPDALEAPPSVETVARWFKNKKVAVKGALLDQSLFAGVGNWVADEVLYQARIAPGRPCLSLAEAEIYELLRQLSSVLALSVAVSADASNYPDTWLFGQRWGGKRGAQEIGNHPIVREPIAGRTTAWVPSVQK